MQRLLITIPLLVLMLPGCGGTPPEPPGTDDGTNDGTLDSTVVVDSDGDGFSDDTEINGVPGTDPFDPTDNPDNVRDTDGDGCSDFDETYFAGFCNNDPLAPSDPGSNAGDGVKVSGSLRIGPTAVVDGDTADESNEVVDNNVEDFTKVQAIPNPSTVGGFLGNVPQFVDVSDVYRVQMAAGQAATLMLADPVANDFDLFLYDEGGNPLASSEGTGKAEQVVAAGNSTFLVEVFGYSVLSESDPGGLYTLLIGSAASPTAASFRPGGQLSSLDKHVEGEVLVGYRDGIARAANAAGDGTVEMEVLNRAAESGGIERVRIKSVRCFGGPNAKPRSAAPPTALNRPSSDTIAAIKRLRRRPDVEYAEPNYIHHPTALPNDEFYPLQWHYGQIHLPEAWDLTTGDPSVIVAVVDTGVVLDHPDLQGNLVAGYDFISDPDSALDGDGIDPNANDPGDQNGLNGSSSFHGTHVAGTVAAGSNNGTGVAGVAWNVRLMPVRVLGKGGGTDFAIIQGIYYAAGLSNSSGLIPAQRADIINLSLGGPGLSQAYQDVIDRARADGVIVIAAAGNDSANADFYSPAGIDGVVTVSAVDLNRTAAPYSNYGTTVDVAAPGGDMGADVNADGLPDGVLSSIGRDDGTTDYWFMDGTSMAAPHVAGVAALMKSVNPQLTPDDFDLLLAGAHPSTSTKIADDLGSPGKDEQYGYGLINAFKAVQAAAEIQGTSVTATPVLDVFPQQIDFGTEFSTVTVDIGNAGAGELVVESVVPSEPWITVSPTTGGEGPYTASVTRSGLADGLYAGAVEFTTNAGIASVFVQMNVGATAATGGDIGTVYVLLIDPFDWSAVAQADATAADGYTFEFSNVAPGEYLLFAGTDMNDDTYIDDLGEAVGGYPTLDQPTEVSAFQERAGLAFSMHYDINLQLPTSASSTGSASEERPRLRRVRKLPVE